MEYIKEISVDVNENDYREWKVSVFKDFAKALLTTIVFYLIISAFLFLVNKSIDSFLRVLLIITIFYWGLLVIAITIFFIFALFHKVVLQHFPLNSKATLGKHTFRITEDSLFISSDTTQNKYEWDKIRFVSVNRNYIFFSIIYFLTVKKYYNNVGYIKQTILNQALPDNFIKLIKDE